MKRIALTFAFAITLTTSSLAANPLESYVAGHYTTAIKDGAAANTALGYLIATRALLAVATTSPQPCLDCLRRAETYARKATALDPKFADAHVYLAVAMGQEARIVGPVWARAHNYPGKAKDELDAALAIDAKNPWALAALGGWHVEIVRTGGDTLASWLYDATVDAGLASFAAAFKVAPDNLTLRYQYALSLGGYDADRFAREIKDAFARIAKLKPATAYEALAKTRATELSTLLAKGDRDAFDAKVHQYQGYP